MNNLYLATFGEIMSYAGYIVIAVLILLIMITVHEFGHYITGKFFGFGIDEFAIGFGPKIFKKVKKNEEIFSVRAFPFGGFCAFHGEDKEDADPKAFNNKKPWQRIIVLISGALMNYFFAVLIIIIMFSTYGQMGFKVENVTLDTPTEYALCDGDVIISANGTNVYLTTDLMNALDKKEQGDLVDFTVRRNGENIKIKVMMQADASVNNIEDVKTILLALGTYTPAEPEGAIYSGLSQTNIRHGFFATIGRSFEYSVKLAGTIFTVLGQLLTGKLGFAAMGGTVTTITVTATAIKTGGFWYVLYMSSFIGVNLAVFNMLPFPALDGSRTVFTTIEWIRKKPIKRKVETVIHTAGFVLLLVIAVLADIQRCF